MKTTLTAKAKKTTPVTFEQAMSWLRKGTPIRRRAWHPESKIFRLGSDVFVKLPSMFAHTPSTWKPYAADFLATDWAKATK